MPAALLVLALVVGWTSHAVGAAPERVAPGQPIAASTAGGPAGDDAATAGLVEGEPACPGLLHAPKSGLCVPRPMPAGAMRSHAATGDGGAHASDHPGSGAAASPPGEPATGAVPCAGDGTSGDRYEVLYVRGADVADRFASVRATLDGAVAAADSIVVASAARTGGTRRVRWVQDPLTCVPQITPVVIPADADGSFDDVVVAIRDQGYGRGDRKYLVFVDATFLCGLGSTWSDDSAGAGNRNNLGGSVAMAGATCWTGHVAAHEMGHTLGAVQSSAPHYSGYGHCTDAYDLMCYVDGPGVVLSYNCPNPSDDDVMDCGNDDYFHTNPAPGSYLATHWNIAQNRFLIGGLASPARPPNDDFADAVTLSGTAGTAAGTTVGATPQPNDGGYLFNPPRGTVWWRFTPPAAGRLRVSLSSSLSDLRVNLYTGTRPHRLLRLTNYILTTMTAGVRGGVPISIEASSPAGGAVSLEWSFTPEVSPPNDLFADAAPILASPAGSTSADLSDATIEPGEPSYGTYVTRSAWWRFVAPGTGTVNLTTAGSSFAEPRLRVYTGSLGGLSQVAASDTGATGGPPSAVSFGVVAGTTYSVAVAGWTSPFDGGLVALAWTSTLTGPPFVASVDAVAGEGAAEVSWTVVANDSAVTGVSVTRQPGGVVTPLPGSARSLSVAGLTPGTPYTFTVVATNASGAGPPRTSAPVHPYAAAGVRFHPLVPFRALDTRAGPGPTGRIGAAATTLLPVAGANDIPASASAVVANITVTGGTAGSYLTAYPAGAPRPTAANLNFAPGQTVPNLVSVKLGASGAIALFNAVGSVHAIVDVVGYYDDGTGAGDGFGAVQPARVLDSRGPVGGWASTPLGADSTRSVTVAGVGSVSPTATAVVMNVTVTAGTQPSFLQAFPSGAPRPVTANVLFGAGQTVPNLVTVKVGAAGSVTFYNQKGSVHVVADVVGYYDAAAGGRFHPVTPTRLVDSRQPSSQWTTPLPADTARVLDVGGRAGIPAAISGVVTNVTVVGGTAASFLTAFPAGNANPGTANLLFGAGQIVPNLVVVGAGSGGDVSIYNQNGSVHVIADAAGYFTG